MWKKLQEELKPWVLHNFGERPKHQPLLGIAEEYGELRAAGDVGEHVLDAVADMVIFMADYSNSNDITLEMAQEPCHQSTDSEEVMRLMAISIGRLSHAHLKKEQGIRKNENHDATKVQALGELLRQLEYIAVHRGYSLESTVYAVWDRVKQRDWKKDTNKGGESHAGTTG